MKFFLTADCCKTRSQIGFTVEMFLRDSLTCVGIDDVDIFVAVKQVVGQVISPENCFVVSKKWGRV
jgi:hypothetical protein